MKLSMRLWLRVLFGLSLFSGGVSLAQQTPSAFVSFECDSVNGEEVKATDMPPPYKICVEYPKDKTRIGRQDVDLTVIIHSPADKPLELAGDPELLAKYEQGILKIDRNGQPWVEGKGVVTYKYPYRVDISDKAEARSYTVKLKLKYKDDPTRFPEGSFSFKVYGGGGIKIANKIANKITNKAITVAGMTGEIKAIDLEIENKYPEYAVTLTGITISSTPSGLVKTVELPRTVKLEPLSEPQKLHNLEFKIKPMQARDWLFGFDNEATLDFTFHYVDEEGHELHGNDKLDLTVRPSILILACAILIGVLAGTAFKFDLQRLRKEGYINSRQMAVFIMSTVVLGLIVSLVALFGEVQVSVFKFNGSYDSPKVLFLISFAATMIGPPLLQGLFKSQKSGDVEPGSEPKPSSRAGEKTTPESGSNHA